MEPGRAERWLERAGEVATIERTVDAARAGRGGLLVVEGAAGIGKTTLLGVAREKAGEAGVLALDARGTELERDFVFGVVRQLLETVLTWPERDALLAGAAAFARPAIDPEQSPSSARFAVAGAPSPIHRILHGLFWLVCNVSERQPVLLTIDDLQWADEASLRFAAYLAARLEGSPLALIVATRRSPGDEAAARTISELVATPGAVIVRPVELSQGAAGELLGDRLGTTPDAGFADAAHAATGGNPFLLRELAEAVRADRLEPVAGNAHRVARLTSATVTHSVLLRLAHLPPSAAAVVRAVAVLGDGAPLRHVAALAGIGDAEAAHGADALAAASLFAAGNEIAFRHPLLRTAVYEDLGPGRRGRLHALAAARLAHDGADPERIAAHVMQAPAAGEQWAVTTLRAAAKAATDRGAPATASRYLERAIQEPPVREERPVVLLELGLARSGAGEVEAARASLAAARDGLDDDGLRAVAWLGLARLRMLDAPVPRTVESYGAALAALPDLPREVAVRLEAERNNLAILHPETTVRGRAWIAANGRPPGRTAVERLLLCGTTRLSWSSGAPAEQTAELARRALGGGALLAEEGPDFNPYHQLPYQLAFCGAIDDARAAIEASIREAWRRGALWGLAAGSTLRAVVAWIVGDVRDTEESAQAALETPTMPGWVQPTTCAFLALALIERGDHDGAEAALELGGCGPALPELEHMSTLFFVRARLRARQGRVGEAIADLREYGHRVVDRCDSRTPALPWRGELALLVTEQDRSEARALADAGVAAARSWGVPAAIGAALRLSGLVHEGDEQERRLTEAEAMLRPTYARLEHAHALVALGASMRRRGLRTRARTPLADGLAKARRVGATALAERAHEELVVAGASPRRLQFSGVEALTAAERRIAGLAAEGHSNREIAQQLFVTPKTVENQLGRVYSKLGINSRRALPAQLRPEDEGHPS